MEALSGAVMDRPVAPRWVARYRLRLWAVIALVVTISAAYLSLEPADRTLRVAADKITIATVSVQPFHDYIPLRGAVVPLDSVFLDVAQGGRVDAMMAEPGQPVKAGQALLRFKDANLELDAIARETQVIEQINNQRSLELSFEQTRSNDARALVDADYNIIRLGRLVARRTPLAGKGFESQENLDQASDELAYQKHLRDLAADAQRRDIAVIDKSIGLIHETADRLDDNLAAAKRMLDALTVRAPIDGVLTAFDAHIGEEKARGDRLGQIDQESGFKVNVPVDEYYVARVRLGQTVDATVSGKPTTLKVAKIYPEVADGKFKIDLTWVGSPPADLRRGEAVQGKLGVAGDEDALVLPTGAFLEASGGAWVFVVDQDGTSAHRRTVRLGRRTPEAVEVLSGLAAGDRVVTSDYTGFDRIDRLVISR